MLENLLIKNKLEFVHIKHGTYLGQDMLHDMVMLNNIADFRYFYIDNDWIRANITLDISQEYPTKLLVFNVKYKNNKGYDYNSGKIEGPKEKVA